MPVPRFGVLLLLFALLLPVGAVTGQDANTAQRMVAVTRRLVQETGSEIVGVGSWISGKGYRDPLRVALEHASDHDMRLVLPRGTPPRVAVARWRATRERLIALIRDEFGDDAGRVLGQTNLYPPSELMSGLEHSGEAVDRFVEMGRTPNLAQRGSVTRQVAERFGEGLWGEGAAPNIQAYERKSGRTFYRVGRRVYVGMTDITHGAEGLERYTARGTANTCSQWAEKAIEALRTRNPQAVAKYLARIERDLLKARQLARLPAQPDFLRHLRELAASVRTKPDALGDLEGAVRAAARRARLESAMIRHADRAGPAGRAVVRAAFEGLDEPNALSRMLRKVAEKLPKVPMDAVVRGLLAYALTVSISQDLGNGRIGRAASAAGAAALAAWMTSGTDAALGTIMSAGSTEIMAGLAIALGPVLMVELNAAMLEAVRHGGYAWVAGAQEAGDLLAGIFTMGGRAGVDARAYTMEQLVSQITTPEALKAFVRARARQAADRGLGPKGRFHDLGSGDAVYEKCYPTILRIWAGRRALLRMELLDIHDRLDAAESYLVYAPAPAPLGDPGVDVRVSLASTNPKVGEMLDRAKAILRILGGPKSKPFAGRTYEWRPAGRGRTYVPERVYTFSKPGTYVVSLLERTDVGEVGLARGSPLSKQMRRTVAVDIEVVEPLRGWILAQRSVDIPELSADHAPMKRTGETSLAWTERYAWPVGKTEHGEEIYRTRSASARATWIPLPSHLIPGEKVSLWTTVEATHVAGKGPRGKGRVLSIPRGMDPPPDAALSFAVDLLATWKGSEQGAGLCRAAVSLDADAGKAHNRADSGPWPVPRGEKGKTLRLELRVLSAWFKGGRMLDMTAKGHIYYDYVWKGP